MPPKLLTEAPAIFVYNNAISLPYFVNYHEPFERKHDSQWQWMKVKTIVDYHQPSWPFERGLTQAWRVNCPITLSNYKHDVYNVLLVFKSGWR